MGKKFAIGAIIGAVAGVVAGVLTAPKSGKETRADIKSKATELKDKAETKASQVADDVKSTAEEYKEKGERAIEDAKRGFKK